jgi:hypothetical protein
VGSGGCPALRSPRSRVAADLFRSSLSRPLAGEGTRAASRRSDRVYREAWVHERAIALLRDEAGTKFDGKCVEALSRVLSRQSLTERLVAA